MNARSLILALMSALPLWAGGADARSDEEPAFTHGYAVSLGASPQLAEEQLADKPFPLMSVVKFPLAILVLHEAEQGRLCLNTRYRLSAADLPTDTWSPLAAEHPQGAELSLLQLLEAAVAYSDNNACAYLFRLVGDAPALQTYLREQMGEGIAIRISHGADYFRDRSKAAGNHASPRAMVALLHACFIERRLLSHHHTRLLWDIMSGPSAGAPRLGLGIPADAVLAHKTGSSGSQNFFVLAYNDVGVLRLADGSTACIASFIRDSYERAPAMDAAHEYLARRVVELLGGTPPPERW